MFHSVKKNVFSKSFATCCCLLEELTNQEASCRIFEGTFQGSIPQDKVKMRHPSQVAEVMLHTDWLVREGVS